MATPRLPSLKAWQLKYWAFQTGMQTTGTKAELQALLTARLDKPPPRSRPTKIVSVDMGIRNLAYCAIEAPALDLHVPDTEFQKEVAGLNKTEKELLRQYPPTGNERLGGLRGRLREQSVKVTAWKRMDLTSNSPTSEDINQDETKPTKRSKPKSKPTQEPSAFTPSSLSQTALTLTHELLTHNPTTILLERQRFRSSGAPAIQEWTVRVNMLESMIWACLATLHSTHNSSSPFPDVLAVSPAQIVNFWSTPASLSMLPPTLFTSPNDSIQKMITQAMTTRTKLEKRDKVALVRKWCSASLVDSDMPMRFSDEAWPVACAFKEGHTRRKKGDGVFEGKLDDVADCLLQGVTWVRWERNRRVLSGMWKKAVEEVNNQEGDGDG